MDAARGDLGTAAIRGLLTCLFLATTACAPVGAASTNRTSLPFAPHGGDVNPPASVWRWQNPLPHGDALLAVSFVDASTGWVVGEGGMVQKSTDGGQTWSIQSAPTTRKLRRVRALSPTTAWAAGDVGTVLRTDDGGATWRAQTTGTTDNLIGFDAPSASVAWAMSDTHVFRTVDGGVTWTMVWQPNFAPVPFCATTLLALAAASADAAFVTHCATVSYTRDGGQTWQSFDFTCGFDGCQRLSGISAGSPADVYVVGSESVRFGIYGRVTHVSHDGGATWSSKYEFMVEPVYGESVVAVSSSVAWATDPLDVRVTTDGGATWRVVRSGGGMVAALSASQAWLLAGTTSILRTADGGTTWSESNKQASATGQWLRGVSVAPDGSTVWAVGSDYGAPDFNHGTAGSYLLRSTDAGGTWSTVSIPNMLPWSVATGGAAVWVGGADGAVARSLDGGATWSSTKLDAPSGQGVVAIAASSANVAWASIGAAPLNGAPGHIYRTIDGGQSWTPQRLPNVGSTQPSVMRMVAVSDSAAWGVDPYHCAVLRTADGGASWSSSTPPSCAGLWGVFATSPTTAFASGQHQDQTPAIYQTTDGGATWLDRPTGFAVDHNSVLFAVGGTEQALWAVGASDGDVTASSDGGLTWHPQRSHAAVGLWGVAAASPSTAWAVGERGAILRATRS